MTLYEELIWRDMIKDISDETGAKRLLNEERTSFYCGFDPTGASLTVGHLVQVVRMRLLQEHGHRAIALIGGATGLIGDPKQTSERKLLTLSESLENAGRIEAQLRGLLTDDASYVNNYSWIRDIDMITFLRDYGKLFSINYMLAKETIAKRLETGISYTEFSYMLIQAIDFLHLYENENCKLQFGGSDQWGNITAGLELIRKVHGDSHGAIGLSSPLLLKADGTKFGKSEKGALWLDAELTSPYEIYQYFLNAADADVEMYLKTLTLLSKDEIEAVLTESRLAPEKRLAQKRLASEVVSFVHGKRALADAESVTDALFTGTFDHLEEQAFAMLAKTLDRIASKHPISVVDALVSTGLASSKREARTFVQSKAVRL
ncbi:MAG: tyrosine--tRNA ligase, partial [Acholeplasmataceae bacterium]